MDSSAPNPKQHIEALGRRVTRLHRRILHPDVLKGSLPMRARTLPARSAAPAARDREARLRASSPAYASAVDDHESFAANTRVIELDGLTWWVPLTQPDDQAAVDRYLTHQDFPYRAITQTREVGLGGVMLDIGANIGRMCVPRVILGDVQAAYCAEPDPLNFACLTRNVRDNHLTGLVLPDNVAIGSTNGTVRLERQKSAGGHKVIDAGMAARREVVEVPSLTLDTWLERLGLDPQELSFVKVDAQGSEVHVLRGAGSVLACTHVAWQIEVDPELLAARQSPAAELFSMLREHFTHFIDLNRGAQGARVRPTAELDEALAYVIDPVEGHTDVLVFNALGLEAATAAADTPPAP